MPSYLTAASALAALALGSGCTYRDHKQASLAHASEMLSSAYVDRLCAEHNARIGDFEQTSIPEREKQTLENPSGLTNLVGASYEINPMFESRNLGRTVYVLSGNLDSPPVSQCFIQVNPGVAESLYDAFCEEVGHLGENQPLEMRALGGSAIRDYGGYSVFLISPGGQNFQFFSRSFKSYSLQEGWWPSVTTDRSVVVKYVANEVYAERVDKDTTEIPEFIEDIATANVNGLAKKIIGRNTEMILNRPSHPLAYYSFGRSIPAIEDQKTDLWYAFSRTVSYPDTLYFCHVQDMKGKPSLIIAAGQSSPNARQALQFRSVLNDPATLILSWDDARVVRAPYVGNLKSASETLQGKPHE